MDFVGLIAYRFYYFYVLLIVYFFIEPENDISFLKKSIILHLFNFKVNISLFITEET